MLQRSTIKLWYLSFNQEAKARPNFGLKGVGLYQRDYANYSTFRTPMVFGLYVVIGCTAYVLKTFHIAQYIEENSGGGPQLMMTSKMQETRDAKPWEFKFLPGEGYAQKPKYKETGVPLDYLNEVEYRTQQSSQE